MINLHSASLTYRVHNCVWINIQNVDIKSGRRNIYLMVARATSRLPSDSWWPLAPAKSRIRDNVKMLNSGIYLNMVSRWHTIAHLECVNSRVNTTRVRTHEHSLWNCTARATRERVPRVLYTLWCIYHAAVFHYGKCDQEQNIKGRVNNEYCLILTNCLREWDFVGKLSEQSKIDDRKKMFFYYFFPSFFIFEKYASYGFNNW